MEVFGLGAKLWKKVNELNYPIKHVKYGCFETGMPIIAANKEKYNGNIKIPDKIWMIKNVKNKYQSRHIGQ